MDGPPSNARPTRLCQTLYHTRIRNQVRRLGEALESGVPINFIQELHELLQYHVTTYFDNEVSGLSPARHRSGRALKTLVQRLKGKEGRFRGNLSGKRVDFSARTVVSPDPNLDINEVGVPLDVASRLTIPEKVTAHNSEEMKRLIDNGPDTYPGALYIVRPDGRRVDTPGAGHDVHRFAPPNRG